MTTSTIDDSPQATAATSRTSSSYASGRIAGLWYLLLIVLGPLRLIYIPITLFVHGNAAATVNNIASHQWLFRLGIVSDLASGVVLILLTLALYRLFEGVDRNLAVLVVIFGGVMPALVNFVGVVSDAATLTIVRGGDLVSAFDKPQRDALAVFFLHLREAQNTSAEMLWGVWLLPLAILVYRSRFFPRFLGVWLAVDGVAYIILCLLGELLPQYSNRAFAYAQPALFGEIAFACWLLLKGARPLAAGASLNP